MAKTKTKCCKKLKEAREVMSCHQKCTEIVHKKQKTRQKKNVSSNKTKLKLKTKKGKKSLPYP